MLKSPSNVSIEDIVNSGLRKRQFGFDFYNTPSNEMLLKKVPLGKNDREKNLSFAEKI